MLKKFILLLIFPFFCSELLIAQTVPAGLNYQAVARDQKGDELINKTIDVRMSVVSGNPTGIVEWEEIHSGISTNPFGIFTLVIGKGTRTGGTITNFEDIPWSDDLHFLKVEIKFDQEFLDMGTTQFLSVPYALFSQKSLTPGPAGPPGPKGDKGDPGDPASDNQELSYDPVTHIISIENGGDADLTGLIDDEDSNPQNELQILSLEENVLSIKLPGNENPANSVSLTDFVEDADADPLNEIQDLRIQDNILTITKNSDSTVIDLSQYLDNTDVQELKYNLFTHKLFLENGGDTIDLSGLIEDEDADNTNEIQYFQLNGDVLTLTQDIGTFDVDLSDYLDNTDDQQLTYNFSTNKLFLQSGGDSIDLSVLINDADSDPVNELITGGILNGTNLEISDAGGITTIDLSPLENIPLTGFRAEKNISKTIPSLTDTTLVFEDEIKDYGGTYDHLSGHFIAPSAGVYNFYLNYEATGDSQILRIIKNGQLFEVTSNKLSNGQIITVSFVLELDLADSIWIQLNTGLGSSCGTGSFSGFRVH
jgi:hypothetical protein